MIPQVDLSRVTPVVVAPLGKSGAKFATDIASRFLKESIGASIDRRPLPLEERIRTLHEMGGRVFFCGVGDEEVSLQMVRVKVGGDLTEHLDLDSAVDFVRAGLEGISEPEPVRKIPAADPRPAAPVERARVKPAEEVVSQIVRRADGTLALRGEFTPETLGELVEFFCGMAALVRPR